MAIDPNIALSIRPTQVQPYDPTNALMKAMTLKSLQQQGQTAELEMARMRRADEDAAAIRGIVGNAGGNLRQAADDLLKGGYFEQAQKINSVLQAEESAKLERATKIGTLLKNSATAVLANPTLDFALNALSEFERTTGLKQDGQRQVLQQIGDNPEAIRRWAAGHALEASQLLPKTSTQDVGGYVSDRAVDPLTGVATETGRTQKTLTPESILTDTRTREEGEKNRQVTVRGQDVSAATARRGQDITVRGQNMTDARAREANANGKVPVGYRANPDGTLSPIKGGPADPEAKPKSLTEQQGKAGLFSTRAEAANKIIEGLGDDFSPLAINAKTAVGRLPLVGGGAEATANLLLSDNSQKAEQAQRDFVNAILRQESGAVIAQDEFDNARKQYFPQPGDSQAVIKQKRQNRLTAIRGLKTMAGPAASKPISNVIDFNDL
jgi:hypothetical protein